MTQTEFGSELTRIHRTSMTGMPHIITYDAFSRFVREQPDKGQQLVHAFRTVRKHTPQLIKCCDMDTEEFNKRENRDQCPREWFASRTALRHLHRRGRERLRSVARSSKRLPRHQATSRLAHFGFAIIGPRFKLGILAAFEQFTDRNRTAIKCNFQPLKSIEFRVRPL